MVLLILISCHYQILVGRIASSNKDGILVSLDFFDDVFIPSYLLQAPSEFNSATSLWLWKYGEEESGDEFVMDIGEQVFRIS
jgi:DNA-directed RNA polymerase III subunit RPC8